MHNIFLVHRFTYMRNSSWETSMQGCTNFPNIYGPPQNSRCYRAKFNPHGDLVSLICAPLPSWQQNASHYTHLRTRNITVKKITPQSTALLHKLTGALWAKKFPVFYGTQRIIALCTGALYLSLFWPRYSSPQHPILCISRSILMLSSYPLLNIPSVLFPPSFGTEIMHTTQPAHLILLITLINLK